MTKADKDKLRKWISKQIREARKAQDEAEEDREKSSWTDIDALEQSCYNEGVINVLKDLRDELKRW